MSTKLKKPSLFIENGWSDRNTTDRVAKQFIDELSIFFKG
jgi:hypothetical protein